MYGCIRFEFFGSFFLFSFQVPWVAGVEFGIEVLIEICVVISWAAVTRIAGTAEVSCAAGIACATGRNWVTGIGAVGIASTAGA